MKWTVYFTGKAAKQYRLLNAKMQDRIDALAREIKIAGPIRGNYKNYGKLGSEMHHCHLKSGRPTYVACWRVVDRQARIVEINYVGTHEKAPY